MQKTCVRIFLRAFLYIERNLSAKHGQNTNRKPREFEACTANKHRLFYRRLTRHRLYTLNFRRLGSRSLRSRDPRQRKFKVYKWCQTSPPCVVHR
ncbi:hypothetical protein TYRP_022405 [Tyrophagus putrescentiae]|nr:hypothetical protein TYRP_022405 [Tyrophagus putrescentiae]